MDQDYFVVTADDVNGVEGSVATFVNNCRGKGVVAVISTMIFNVRERRNIKLADPCIGSVAAAVNMSGGK